MFNEKRILYILNGAGGEALGAAINGLANNEWIDIWNDGRVHYS